MADISDFDFPDFDFSNFSFRDSSRLAGSTRVNAGVRTRRSLENGSLVPFGDAKALSAVVEKAAREGGGPDGSGDNKQNHEVTF